MSLQNQIKRGQQRQKCSARGATAPRGAPAASLPSWWGDDDEDETATFTPRQRTQASGDKEEKEPDEVPMWREDFLLERIGSDAAAATVDLGATPLAELASCLVAICGRARDLRLSSLSLLGLGDARDLGEALAQLLPPTSDRIAEPCPDDVPAFGVVTELATVLPEHDNELLSRGTAALGTGIIGLPARGLAETDERVENELPILRYSGVTSLSLTADVFQDRRVGPLTLAPLVEALSANRTLTELTITDSTVGPTGGELLAKLLRQNAVLTALNVARGQMGDGCHALACAVGASRSLLTLNLSDNLGVWTAEDVSSLLGGTLTALDLSHNGFAIGAECALALALRSNTTLRDLELRGCGVDDAVGSVLARALEHNGTLTALGLGSNAVGAETVAALAAVAGTNSSLARLDLSRQMPPLRDRATWPLPDMVKSLRSLEELDLGWNAIDYEVAATIVTAARFAPFLRGLTLAHNPLNASVEPRLASLVRCSSSLKHLDVRHCRLGGMQRLLDALEDHSRVRALLDGN